MILPAQPTAAEPSTSGSSLLKLRKGAKMVHGTTSATSSDAPLPPIQTIESAFQMAEYLALLIKHDPHDIDRIVPLPAWFTTDKRDKKDIAKDTALWIYEHLRRLPVDLTPLITSLLPVCTRETCPEMRAGEWQYICVAHEGKAGEECCAIDYILHTVDSMTATLVSTQSFPSRLSIKPGSEKLFGQLARRISRVFGHAYFHHREVFEECEAETALYARFVGLAKRYNLVSKDLLVIPESATQSKPRAADAEHADRRVEESFERPEGEDQAIPTTSRKINAEGDEDLNGGRTSGRGRGTGRAGKTRRTLFPVDIEKDPEAEDDDEEDDQSKSDGKAEETAEEGKSTSEEQTSRELKPKESIESIVFTGSDDSASGVETRRGR